MCHDLPSKKKRAFDNGHAGHDKGLIYLSHWEFAAQKYRNSTNQKTGAARLDAPRFFAPLCQTKGELSTVIGQGDRALVRKLRGGDLSAASKNAQAPA
jgi:hypothetical protein